MCYNQFVYIKIKDMTKFLEDLSIHSLVFPENYVNEQKNELLYRFSPKQVQEHFASKISEGGIFWALGKFYLVNVFEKEEHDYEFHYPCYKILHDRIYYIDTNYCKVVEDL